MICKERKMHCNLIAAQVITVGVLFKGQGGNIRH